MAGRGTGGLHAVWWVVLTLLVLLGASHVLVRLIVTASFLERRLTPALRSATDSVYRIEIGSARASLFGRSLAVRALVLEPDSTVLARRPDAAVRRTHVSLDVASLQLRNIELLALLKSRVAIGEVALASPRFEVALDRTLPPDPEAGPPMMPHRRLQQLSIGVDIDSLTVQNGTIRYHERAPGVGRFGTLVFGDLSGSARNLTNIERRVPPALPATIDARFRLANQGQLTARLRYDLFTRELEMSYRGELEPMDARALNEFMIPVVGYRIQSGVIDTGWFDIAVREGTATGQVQMLFRRFEVMLVDQNTGEPDLTQEIKSFLADKFVVRSRRHVPGEASPPPRTIHLERDPSLPVLRFLWATLRQGLAETLGL